MVSGDSGFGANVSKKVDEFAIYFPDLDEDTGLNPTIIDAIKADPNGYRIQLVSPMGFFSEIFSFDADSIQEIAYEDTTHYRIYKQFFADRSAFFENGAQGTPADEGRDDTENRPSLINGWL